MVENVRAAVFLLAGILALTACTQPPPTGDAEGAALAQLLESWTEASTQLDSNGAVGRGDYRFNDRFVVTISAAHLEADAALNREFLERLRTLPREKLHPTDRVSYDLFEYERRMAIEGHEVGWARAQSLMPVFQFFSTHHAIINQGTGASVIPFRTVSDYDNWLKRMDGWYEWVDVAIENMRIGMEEGITQPRVVIERTLPQLEAQLVERIEDSLFWKPVQDMPDGFSESERARIEADYTQAIATRIVPSFRKLHDFLRDEYLPQARETHGIFDLPNGDALYSYLGRFYTTTDLSVAEVHILGLREVERILDDMYEVMDEIGFQGSLRAFFDWLRDEPGFRFESREALLQGYEDLREVVESRVDGVFHRRPAAPYEIHPIAEFEERSQAGAYYSRPAPDGSRPGRFFVNTYDLRARPRYAMTALFLHEAIPGHHFQIGLQQENTDLPAFRRFGGPVGFVEGWALYAETLGHEMGLYRDPYQRFGQLTAEIWRANRLVIDTGIHLHGWTLEDGIAQMADTTSMGMTDITAEVERYIAWPGQALAFKIGQLKILELREQARAALGDDFDIRDFHEVVLAEGAMPLAVLERRVQEWIAKGTHAP